jgi:hypothetical protein
MRTTSNHAFVNQFLVYTLVTIGFSGTVGLGTVWMRHQISLTANANRTLETRIVELQRHLAETATAIESEQDSDVLRRRNAEWRLGLMLPSPAQVVHLTEDPALHLATKRERGLFGDGTMAIVFPPAFRR